MYIEWINQHAVPFPAFSVSTVLNYVPVIATIVTTILSLVLARATLRNVEATDKGLALAHEQFEREWAPELHVKLEQVSAQEAKLIITNLAKASVLLQLVQMRKISHGVPFERMLLNDPLVGGVTWSHSVSDRLLAFTGPHFDGTVAVSVTFYAAGRLFRSDWFRFEIHVHDGKFVRISAITLPARRVRVLETRTPGKFRIDLAQDVARIATEPVER
ncbi:MAG TPA: hypothetical protein VFZ99_04730 [Terriglobales bacterium]